MTQRLTTILYAACLTLLAVAVPMLVYFVVTDIFH
jgi:hypothetical protein